MSGDVDGALPIPRSEVFTAEVELKNVSPELFETLTGMTPEQAQGKLSIPMRPASEWDSEGTRKLIHDALSDAVMRQVATEEEVARTAILLGIGYARIETWTPNSVRVDYIITRLVPPMEVFEFPNWSSFEVWRGQQERRRG